MLQQKPYTFDRVIRIAITIGIVYAAYLLIDLLSGVLIPFAVAALLAYLIHPLVDFLQYKAKFKNRALSVLSALIIVGGFLFLIGRILLPILYDEIQHLTQLLSQFAMKDLSQIEIPYLPKKYWESIASNFQNGELTSYLSSNKIQELITEYSQKALPELWSAFSSVLNVVLTILGLSIIILYLIFILIDYEKIMYGWRDYLLPHYKEQVVGLVDEFSDAMKTYFRAQGLIALSVGVLFAIGFGIIGLPLGIILGLFVGLLNMVPYLQIVGFIPATLLALIYSLESGESFWSMFLLVLLVFALVQTIQDAVLTPKIMGNATGLNPAVILLSLSIWGTLLGFLGLVIGLPLTFLIISYYKRFLTKNFIVGASGEKQEQQL